jgi:hypothetical protein
MGFYDDDYEDEGLKVLIWTIIILFIISFSIGWGVVYYNNTVGKQVVKSEKALEKVAIDKDRENFKESKPYIEGMVSDLAKHKYEYETEKDTIAKKAIADLIITKFANFDATKIEDETLRHFLINIRKGEIEQ